MIGVILIDIIWMEIIKLTISLGIRLGIIILLIQIPIIMKRISNNTDDDSGEISIEDDSLENLDPPLRNSIDDITSILNAKIRNSDISAKHKESIETQIEVLANLIKSIPSND